MSLSPAQTARHELREGLACANRLLRRLPEGPDASILINAIAHVLYALDVLETAALPECKPLQPQPRRRKGDLGIALLAVALLAAPLPAQRWTTLDRVSAGAAVATVVADCVTTAWGVSQGQREITSAWLLGRRPSPLRLAATCSLGIATTFAVASVTKRRTIVFVVVAIVEVVFTAWNVATLARDGML